MKQKWDENYKAIHKTVKSLLSFVKLGIFKPQKVQEATK